MNNLALAIEGRLDILKMIFGGSEGPKPKPQTRPMTADRWRNFTRQHNAKMRRKAAGHG